MTHRVLVRSDKRPGPLSERLHALGFSAEPAVSTAALRAGLEASLDPCAVLVDLELPEDGLAEGLGALALPMRSGRATALAIGPRPSPARAQRLRDAGLALGLFEPYDDAALRFQLQRALLPQRNQESGRCDRRSPFQWTVSVHVGGRTKTATLENLSRGGAYLATSRPCLRGARLRLELPLPGGRKDVQASVVHTNVPGNLCRPLVPLGMGVRFGALPEPIELAIADLVERRGEALEL